MTDTAIRSSERKHLMPGHSASGDTVVYAGDKFLRRAMRLAPSTDPWADAITETVMANMPEAPNCVVDAFSEFARNYARQTEKRHPSEMDWPWLFTHFKRLSGLVGDSDGVA